MPSDLESGRLAPAKASSSSKSKNLDELPISLKVNFEDVVRRHKLSLRDMGAATLEPKASLHSLAIDPFMNLSTHMRTMPPASYHDDNLIDDCSMPQVIG